MSGILGGVEETQVTQRMLCASALPGKMAEKKKVITRVIRQEEKLPTNVGSREEESEERPGRYKSPLEEIRHELRELWGGPPYERGDKLPATLSREECRQLMTAYLEGKWAFRNNLISRILYATGLRGEELENLKVCDVLYDQGTIFIRAGKGDKDRYVCAVMKRHSR